MGAAQNPNGPEEKVAILVEQILNNILTSAIFRQVAHVDPVGLGVSCGGSGLEGW